MTWCLGGCRVSLLRGDAQRRGRFGRRDAKADISVNDHVGDKLSTGERGFVVIGKRPNRVDFMNFLDGENFEQAWNRRVSRPHAGVEAAFLSLDHYVATRRAAGRPKNLWDLATLRAILGPLPEDDAG